MTIPLIYRLAQERAASFLRSVEFFTDEHGQVLRDNSWSDLWVILRPVSRDSLDLIGPTQLNISMLIENALRWAHTKPLPQYSHLRQVRPLLEHTLSDWGQAWRVLGTLLKRNSSALSHKHWFRDACSAALIEQRRAVLALEESWPLPALEQEELLAKEMRAGKFVELDDAFPLLAAIPKDEWERIINQRGKTPTVGGAE